jgi:pyroglutamyl-peptidase
MAAAAAAAAAATTPATNTEAAAPRPRLVIAPGSGVFSDEDALAFELPPGGALEVLEAGGEALLPRLERLLEAGRATRAEVERGAVIEVRIGDLLPERGEIAMVRARTGGAAACVELRRAPAPERYEGGPGDTRVLVTGFQPFPAECEHENVSAVAVTALDPTAIRGARVMRLVLPVEYDRSAAAVREVIARCRPDIVISFGQGNASIALEEIAYNLQGALPLPRANPDNRGEIRSGAVIEPDGPAERAVRLPLGAIELALAALGEEPRRSRDPGRYICNDVLFGALGTAVPRAGFIHLPRITEFTPASRARYGRLVAAAVQAVLDAR